MIEGCSTSVLLHDEAVFPLLLVRHKTQLGGKELRYLLGHEAMKVQLELGPTEPPSHDNACTTGFIISKVMSQCHVPLHEISMTQRSELKSWKLVLLLSLAMRREILSLTAAEVWRAI